MLHDVFHILRLPLLGFACIDMWMPFLRLGLLATAQELQYQAVNFMF